MFYNEITNSDNVCWIWLQLITSLWSLPPLVSLAFSNWSKGLLLTGVLLVDFEILFGWNFRFNNFMHNAETLISKFFKVRLAISPAEMIVNPFVSPAPLREQQYRPTFEQQYLKNHSSKRYFYKNGFQRIFMKIFWLPPNFSNFSDLRLLSISMSYAGFLRSYKEHYVIYDCII